MPLRRKRRMLRAGRQIRGSGMTTITEIAADVFRISTFVPEAGIQFNQFLVRDDEPLLYHTGMRSLFPAVHDAVGQLIDPASLRWIGFSHFEPDECGSLNLWLELAPGAAAVTSHVGATVFLGDYAARAPRILADGEIFETGARRFHFCATPHLPHGWDAAMLFEETERVLFCSDLLHQLGDVEAATGNSVTDRFRETLTAYQQGPMAGYMAWTPDTGTHLARLAALAPRVCATMHGSAYEGDGAQAMTEVGEVMREVYAPV